MSYTKTNDSRGVGAIAARDLGALPTSSASMTAAQRAAAQRASAGRAPVVGGLVPPLTGPARATGIGAGRLAPMSPTPRPGGISVTPPPTVLRPLAVVTPAGRPMAVVTPVPVPGDPRRLAVAVPGSPPGRIVTVTTARGTVKKGTQPKKKPVWVNKAKDCPKGYFIKKTVIVPSPTGIGMGMKFWCWPNPVSTQKRVVKAVARKTPAHKITTTPGQPRGGIKLGRVGRTIKIRGPVAPAGNLPPGTSVDTPAGIGCVVPTPSGNVVVPGAVPVGNDLPVGSTVSTDAGPATVIDTPAGNMAIPESMAPPEDEWANDAAIDELLGDTKDAVAQDAADAGEPTPPEAAPGAPVVDEGAPPVATAAEQKDMKKGGVGTLALIGGAGWLALKFFL